MFEMTEDQIELIHRVFGGTKIIESSVQTVDSGGGFMHDLYNTECGHIVLVYEYGAMFLPTMEDYMSSNFAHKPHFSWDKPLCMNKT